MPRHCLSKPTTHSSLAFHFPVRVRKPYQLRLKEGPMTRFNNSPVFKFPKVAPSAKRPPAMQKTPVPDRWVRKIPCRRNRQPIPAFLPGKSHGLRSLVGCRLWGRTESDTTDATEQQQQQQSSGYQGPVGGGNGHSAHWLQNFSLGKWKRFEMSNSNGCMIMWMYLMLLNG